MLVDYFEIKFFNYLKNLAQYTISDNLSNSYTHFFNVKRYFLRVFSINLYIYRMKKHFISFIYLLALTVPQILSAQLWVEPELTEVKQNGTPYEKGARKGIGFELILNDFGFSIGSQFRYLISSSQEYTINFAIGSLRDVSEQTFTTYFSEIIPNKYNRVLNFPLLFGFKQRILSSYIQDNLRFTIQSSMGPSPAFVYPYFIDVNENGFRDTNLEPVIDALSEWGRGAFKFGAASEIMLGMDFGQDNKGFSCFRFGIVMHYFGSGIQIMEPNKLEITRVVGNEIYGNIVPSAKPQHFFISPQFNLVIGSFW